MWSAAFVVIGLAAVGGLGWLTCAVLTFVVTAQKGYPAVRWFLLALPLGPLALIGACGLPDLELRRMLLAGSAPAGARQRRIVTRYPSRLPMASLVLPVQAP